MKRKEGLTEATKIFITMVVMLFLIFYVIPTLFPVADSAMVDR